MSDTIVKSEFFNALLPYIVSLGVGTYIEISLPPSLEIDNNIVMQYFNEDTVMMCYTRKGCVLARNIMGSLKSKEVFDYIKAGVAQLVDARPMLV